jgi:SpoVK/Ycf46/Vps4 family AAA+-type ATPase
MRLFYRDHVFACGPILAIRPGNPGEPLLKGALTLSEKCLSLVTTGKPWNPALSAVFPAQRLTTGLSWSDLVLHPATKSDVDEIAAWIKHGETMMAKFEMAAKLRPGHRSLFYGPPGTGKTLTAALLGASTGHEVYRIDLSLVVSKYIGETEKNLSHLFDQAERQRWILFFDEADALFGRRSETRDAHDRYANQEVAYLLQRVESFDGVAILATNLRDNIDAAFMRRFDSTVYFPLPRAEERLELWRKGFPSKASDRPLDFEAIARDYPLSGGAIMNAIRHVLLQSLIDGGLPVREYDLVASIQREYIKEGRSA